MKRKSKKRRKSGNEARYEVDGEIGTIREHESMKNGRRERTEK